MSVSQTPTGFSLESFLTRVIPGLVALSPFFVSLYIADPAIFQDQDFSLLVIGVLALIIGELIEHVRSGLLRVPLPFSYNIYWATGDASFLPKWFRYTLKIKEVLPDRIPFYEELPEESRLETRLNFDMQTEMETKFELDPDKASARDFYDALLLYLGDGISSRTKEYRSTYIFNQNLRISAIISIFFYGYEIFITYPNPRWVVFFFVVIVLFTGLFVVGSFLTASPHVYMEMLVKEFYMKTLSE